MAGSISEEFCRSAAHCTMGCRSTAFITKGEQEADAVLYPKITMALFTIPPNKPARQISNVEPTKLGICYCQQLLLIILYVAEKLCPHPFASHVDYSVLVSGKFPYPCIAT